MRVESKFGNYFEVQIVQCTGTCIASLVSACTNTWAFSIDASCAACTHGAATGTGEISFPIHEESAISSVLHIPKQKAVLNLERGNHSQPDGHFKISLASLPVVVSSRLYYQHKAAVIPLTALHCSTTTSQVQKEPPASADSRCTARRRGRVLRQSHDSPPKKSYGRAEKCTVGRVSRTTDLLQCGLSYKLISYPLQQLEEDE